MGEGSIRSALLIIETKELSGCVSSAGLADLHESDEAQSDRCCCQQPRGVSSAIPNQIVDL
jgi:hypothetical protein